MGESQVFRGAWMRRELFYWPLMVAATIAIATLGIELMVRVVIDDGMQFDLEMWKYARDVKQVAADPRIGHEHRPNTRAHLMGVEVAINSRGLRDREIPYERGSAPLRILMLGDSFTEGWGVPVEDTWSKRIERLYAQRGTIAEVINAGVGNYNTVMEVSWFFAEGRKYRPDIVVLNATFNDAELMPPHDKPNLLLNLCEACAFLSGRADTLLREGGLRPDWKAYYLGLYDAHSQGWIDAKNAMRRLSDYARANNVALLVTSTPELHELSPYPLQSITANVEEAAKQNGAEFIDTLPALQSEPPRALWVAPTDPHPNARANALIADALFAKLTVMNTVHRSDREAARDWAAGPERRR
jgi:lysophospholipase L1-like esterase